jgi:hypothetical protein
LVRELKSDLQKHPHFLITEHDFQAYLYSKSKENSLCNDFVIDNKGDENYLLHTEYPRGQYVNDRYVSRRKRWDLVILKDDLCNVNFKKLY